MEFVQGFLVLLIFEQHNSDLPLGLYHPLVGGGIHFLEDGFDFDQTNLVSVYVPLLLLVSPEHLVHLGHKQGLMVVVLSEYCNSPLHGLLRLPVVVLVGMDLRLLDVGHRTLVGLLP